MSASETDERRAEIEKLYADGQVAEALDKLWALTDQSENDPHTACWAIFWLSNRAIFDKKAVPLVDRAIESYAKSEDFLVMAAQMIMAAEMKQSAYTRAIPIVQEAIRLKEGDSFAHLLLLRLRLLQNDYMGAYLSGCASTYLGHDLGSLFELSKLLIKGIEILSFPFEGHEYSFRLSTRTPACVHTSGMFLNHRLTEPEELAYTRDVIGPVDSVIEIGTLMGTHTAFYLKNLRPSTMVCVEAIPELAQVTLSAAEMNQEEGHKCDVRIVNAWAGQESSGTVDVDGTSVQKLSIDSIAQGQCDFIKIDVDGGELSVLQGAEKLLRSGTPKLMVEIAKANETEVLGWLRSIGYKPVHMIERTNDSNYFFERVPTGA
ncbi:MAG: FkbM family methyltransferase [Rhodospirillales bacterium]